MTWTHLRNQTATAADLRRNFQHVRFGSLLPLGGVQSFAPTNIAFDLGGSTVRWAGCYLSGTTYVAGTMTVQDGTVTTVTAISTDIMSVSSIALGPGVKVIESATSEYIAGNLVSAGVRIPFYSKRIVGQYMNTSATIVPVAHSISSAMDTIVRSYAVYHGATRDYQNVTPSTAGVLGFGVLAWDDTYLYLDHNTPTKDTTTITVFIEYAPGLGMDIV